MRKASVFITILIISGTILAQTPKSFMIKPGILMAKQIWDDYPHNSDGQYLEGLYVGVNVEFFHHQYFSFVTEAGFSMKRNTYYRQDKSIDYLYLAPMLKVRYEFGRIIPSIYIGPRVDYMLTDSYENAIPFGKTNDFIFGISSGVDLEYNFDQMAIILGFQNQFDLTPSIESTSSAGNMKYNAFAIYAGIKLYIPGKSGEN